MNSKDPRKELEASLTALLLGELPPDKAFELGRAIEQDAELAKLHERLKKTIGLVRETAANPVETVAAQPAPVKMAEERREKLLQHFKTVAPKQFARPARRRKFPIAELSMAAGFVALLAVGFALFEPAANKLGLDLENPTKLPEADSIAFAGESLRDHNGRVQVSGRVRNLTKSLEEEQKQLSRLQWDNASGATRVDRKMAEGAVEEAVTRGKTERLARRTYPEHTLPAAKGDAGNFRYYYGLNPNGSFPTDGSASPGSRVVARGGAGGGGGGPVLTSSAQKPASEGIVLPSLAQATDATSVKDYDWFAGNQAVQHSAENFSLARNEAEPGDNFFAERQPARTAAGTAVTPVDVIDPATGLIVSDDTSSTAGGLAHFSAGAAGRAVTATKPAAEASDGANNFLSTAVDAKAAPGATAGKTITSYETTVGQFGLGQTFAGAKRSEVNDLQPMLRNGVASATPAAPSASRNGRVDAPTASEELSLVAVPAPINAPAQPMGGGMGGSKGGPIPSAAAASPPPAVAFAVPVEGNVQGEARKAEMLSQGLTPDRTSGRWSLTSSSRLPTKPNETTASRLGAFEFSETAGIGPTVAVPSSAPLAFAAPVEQKVATAAKQSEVLSQDLQPDSQVPLLLKLPAPAFKGTPKDIAAAPSGPTVTFNNRSPASQPASKGLEPTVVKRSFIPEAEKVPVLGDVPTAGRLFRSGSKVAAPSEGPLPQEQPNVASDLRPSSAEAEAFRRRYGLTPQLTAKKTDGHEVQAQAPVSLQLSTDAKQSGAVSKNSIVLPGQQEESRRLFENSGKDLFYADAKKLADAPALQAQTEPLAELSLLRKENGLGQQAKANSLDRELLRENEYEQAVKKRELAYREDLVKIETAWDTPTKKDRLPQPDPYARSTLIHTGPGRSALYDKLDRIRLDTVKFDGLPLGEVIVNLSDEAKKRDPEKRGINFLFNPNAAAPAAAVINPATGLPEAPAAPAEQVDLKGIPININPPLSDVRLADVLDAIATVANPPVKYSVGEYAIVFAAKGTEQTPLEVRTFKVDPNAFYQGLQSVGAFVFGETAAVPGGVTGGRQGGGQQQGGQGGAGGGLKFLTTTNNVEEVSAAARNYFVSKGVDLNQPGKNLLFNDREGLLVVRATSADLDTMEKAVQILGARTAAEQKREVDAPKAHRPPAPAAEPQPEVQSAENAFSTFSLNVSDVSFKLAAASLEKGQMPEAAGVRSEEFINAFDYRDPEPPPGVPVAFAWERAAYPFAHNRDLVRFSIKTAAAGRQPGRPLNLVLLLDNSGSMERADRVRIIQEALRVLAAQLQPQDKFSVVTFARTARLWVDGVAGDQAREAAEKVSGLTPEGGTNLEEAMNTAYQTAARHYLANGVNRVVLLTDGAANLGNVDPVSLKQKVESQRKQGIALDCFGIGWEGYNDDLLEVLSRNGDGRYGFINTPEEAASGFAGQLAGALRVAASDVKVQVEFNPKRATAYRQIGYARHQLKKEQFRDNTVDAAEIGAAEAGNALYVVEVNPRGEGPIGIVRVRYKVPGTTEYHEHEWAVPYTGNAGSLDQASWAMRLAASASAFSEWLVSSPYAADVTPDKLLSYLRGVPEVCGADARPKKLEWMIRQANSITGK